MKSAHPMTGINANGRVRKYCVKAPGWNCWNAFVALSATSRDPKPGVLDFMFSIAPLDRCCRTTSKISSPIIPLIKNDPTKILTKSQLSTMTATTATRKPNGPRTTVNSAACGRYPKKHVAMTIPADRTSEVITEDMNV